METTPKNRNARALARARWNERLTASATRAEVARLLALYGTQERVVTAIIQAGYNCSQPVFSRWARGLHPAPNWLVTIGKPKD